MGNKYLKLGKALYNAGKKKLSGVASKTSPKTTSKKTTPKQAPVKPRTIDFKKAKRTLAGTAGVSAGVGAGGHAAPAEAKTYNGARKLLGIATLHKSNMVPVFSQEDAVEISKMRRG